MIRTGDEDDSGSREDDDEGPYFDPWAMPAASASTGVKKPESIYDGLPQQFSRSTSKDGTMHRKVKKADALYATLSGGLDPEGELNDESAYPESQPAHPNAEQYAGVGADGGYAGFEGDGSYAGFEGDTDDAALAAPGARNTIQKAPSSYDGFDGENLNSYAEVAQNPTGDDLLRALGLDDDSDAGTATAVAAPAAGTHVAMAPSVCGFHEPDEISQPVGIVVRYRQKSHAAAEGLEKPPMVDAPLSAGMNLMASLAGSLSLGRNWKATTEASLHGGFGEIVYDDTTTARATGTTIAKVDTFAGFFEAAGESEAAAAGAEARITESTSAV